MQAIDKQSATIHRMPTSLHIRDVPDSVHRTLVERADRRGMSLRQYTLEILTEHLSLPTLDEWLDDLGSLPPGAAATSAADAVRLSREADDDAVAAARSAPSRGARAVGA